MIKTKIDLEDARAHNNGFVQVRLEVLAINISNIAALVRAGQTSLSISFYYLTLSKAKQRLRADGILMPHLHKAPTLAEIIRHTSNFAGSKLRHYETIIRYGTLFDHLM